MNYRTPSKISFWPTKNNGFISNRMYSATSILISVYCLRKYISSHKWKSNDSADFWVGSPNGLMVSFRILGILFCWTMYQPCQFHLKSSFFHANGMVAGSSGSTFLFASNGRKKDSIGFLLKQKKKKFTKPSVNPPSHLIG